MDAIRIALAGKKTHAIAVILIALVVMEKFLGLDIPGFEPGDDWLVFVLNAFGLSTLRAGIAKAIIGRVL